MKKKSILSLMIASLTLSGVGALTSCEDVIRPDIDRYVENFSGKDTVYFYLGIMRNLQELVENNALAGELRSDLVTSTDYTSDTVANIMNFENLADGSSSLLNRAAYYKVINQCNFYLEKVDTLSSKNGHYYMRRETAQVLATRAWTYLQLVQAYGEVPFITQPVRNANTGLEQTAPKINADNMVDLLRVDLQRAMVYQETYGKVNYGNYNTGSPDVNSVALNIPPSVVLADMYLMRGASTADYEAAAQLYYDYLRRENGTVVKERAATWTELTFSGIKSYSSRSFSWRTGVSLFQGSNYTAVNGEVRTFVPSAANSAFGLVLTKIPNLLGFESTSVNQTAGSTSGSSSSSESSSSSTSTSESSSSSSSSATTVGTVSLNFNYRMRQVAPSNSYLNLNKSQIYSHYRNNSSSSTATSLSSYDLEYYPSGDARVDGTAPEWTIANAGRMRFIFKFGSSTDGFRYCIPVYRIRKIYLNFAEAINRAGFPRHAFAILRDGLGGLNSFMSIAGTVNKIPQVFLSRSTYNDTDSIIYLRRYVGHVENGLDYLTADEILRANDKAYLQFGPATPFNNYGIHELGSGEKGDLDTLYTYAKIVSQRILDEATRSNTLTSSVQDLAAKIAKEVYTDTITVDNTIDRSQYKVEPAPDPVAPSAEEINAVETLILDEMALEAAYEGYRMGDLIRVARHKNAAGTDGTTWLAWKIARRNLNIAPYENPTSYDPTLYSKLLNTSYWYLSAPQ